MTSRPNLKLVSGPGPQQYYDPHHLVDQVEALLRRHGLDPNRIDVAGEPALRLTGASMLLRGFGLMPAASMEDHYGRHDGDRDVFRDHGEPAPGYDGH